MAEGASRERQALEQLGALCVAKEIFLAEWYRESCETLGFSGEALEELDRIARETRDERDEILRLSERWSTRRADREGRLAALEVAWYARLEFLQNLRDVKTAAGEAIERAARLAPPEFREELFALAAVDFRHALRLREMATEEVEKHLGPGRP